MRRPAPDKRGVVSPVRRRARSARPLPTPGGRTAGSLFLARNASFVEAAGEGEGEGEGDDLPVEVAVARRRSSTKLTRRPWP